MTNVFSWIAICTGIAIIPAQLIIGIALFYNLNYTPQPWHYFLIYQAINGCVLLYNITLLKRSLWIHDLSCKYSNVLWQPHALLSDNYPIVFVTLATFFIITIICIARSSFNFESSTSVWATFINDSGWSSGGVTFLTGLVTPNYMYAGIDGALHLAEECINASTVVPRALLSTLIIGFVTSFCFVIAMLYCTSDLATIATSNTGYGSFSYCSLKTIVKSLTIF